MLLLLNDGLPFGLPGPPATRTVLKKASRNLRPSPQRTPSERDEWLAEMGYAVAQRKWFDPTEADRAEIRAALGDNGAFAKFSDANEALLFSVIITLQRKLEVHGENNRFEKELAVEVSKAHDLLSVVGNKMREAGWTTAAEARQINEAADILLLRIATEPGAFDGRTAGSRRKQDEAISIADCLKPFKAVVHGVKAVDWDDLGARIARYMSGKKIDPGSLKRRRQRARAT